MAFIQMPVNTIPQPTSRTRLSLVISWPETFSIALYRASAM
jgi:hypothetical protein